MRVPSAKPVCYAFQRGECTRGDACRFSHTEGPNGGGGGGGYGSGGGGSAPVCYAFQRGECTRGDACRFSHTEGGGGNGGGFGASRPQFRAVLRVPEGRVHARGLLPLLARPQRSGAPRSSQPCYAFQKGECSRGDSCRFSHEVTF